MKQLLVVKGLTEDNKIVVGGVYSFIATHGIPLEDMLFFLKEKNYSCSWIDFFIEGLTEGSSLRTLNSRVRSSLGEVYKSKELDLVLSKLDKLLENVNGQTV